MVIYLIALCLIGGAHEDATNKKIEALLSAIEAVETGGCKDPARAVGDGGRSRGWYQIGYAYWLDAKNRKRSRQAWADYLRDVRDRDASRDVVRRYWRRYEPEALRAGDVERLARCHNGALNWRKAGPKARAMMDGYVAKVKAKMEAKCSTK